MRERSRWATGRRAYRVRVRDGRGVPAVELVGALDRVVLPVGPVDPVFEHADRERVAHVRLAREHDAPARAVVVAARDQVHLAVDPEQAPVDPVERDAVRPFDVRVDEHLAVRAVHAGALDARRGAPVRPVEPAL